MAVGDVFSGGPTAVAATGFLDCQPGAGTEAHAIEGDGHGVRDSTVLSITECLTQKGSLSVPQNRLRCLTLNSFPPPLPKGRGILGGI
jgi:hypothetical protein